MSVFGAVVQLVRISACHAGGHGFESRPFRQHKWMKNFMTKQYTVDWFGYRCEYEDQEELLKDATVIASEMFSSGINYKVEILIDDKVKESLNSCLEKFSTEIKRVRGYE